VTALANASLSEENTTIDVLVIVISNCSLDSSFTPILSLSSSEASILKSQGFDLPYIQ
jgi:hypothetical protein